MARVIFNRIIGSRSSLIAIPSKSLGWRKEPENHTFVI
jgi:hypothetical protein